MSNVLKTIGLAVLCILLTGRGANSQTTPTIFVNGSEIMSSNLSLGSPLWLSEGQTVAKGALTVYINVLQYNKVSATGGGYTLQFDTPLIVTNTSGSPATVPAGKVWKIESVGQDKTAQAFGGDNLGNHVATATLNMNNNLVSNVTNPVASKDAVNVTTLQNGNLVYGVDIGAADAYSVVLSPAISAYTAGMIVNFKASNNNTGSVAATLNVNGLGAKTIKKQGGNSDLAANDVTAGQVVSVVYDGTNFQIIGQLGNVSGGAPHGRQLFTTSGTFIVPANVTTVYISMTGGGGSGGANVSGGGGGGGGASVFSYPVTVTPLASITVTVGAGAAGVANNLNGSNGGSSSFGSFTAGGGNAGLSSGTGGNGGTGSTGVLAGGKGNNGSSNAGGDGGSTIFGAGGGGLVFGNGGNGTGYGGGGAGGGNGNNSGSGASGFVLVEW